MSAENRKAVIAGTIGNVLEWYDFGVYGYFATTISQLFFPGDERPYRCSRLLPSSGSASSCARSARSYSASMAIDLADAWL